MNNRSAIRDPRSKIVVAGAGPAGSSLAIRLAQTGFETFLVERESFPRQKLCGEFISPECFRHFRDLGILERMLDAGGDRIYETRFFESGGRSIAVPSQWFGQGEFALSLSRAEMDHLLLQRARDAGVSVRESTTITGVDTVNGRVATVRTKAADGSVATIDADIFVDATGRSRTLSKLVERKRDRSAAQTKPQLVGFKAHLRDVDMRAGLCEIYSFPGGYAGLSRVEGGVSNLCFLIKASIVRSMKSDADELVRRIVTRNKRASVTLQGTTPVGDWLAVSIDGFGVKDLVPAANLFSVGDAAGFIDPFTGSGMVMAFESAAVLAGVIGSARDSEAIIGETYRAQYNDQFSHRLRVCSLLRRTAFMPRLATGIVYILGLSTGVRRRLARATRSTSADVAQ